MKQKKTNEEAKENLRDPYHDSLVLSSSPVVHHDQTVCCAFELIPKTERAHQGRI